MEAIYQLYIVRIFHLQFCFIQDKNLKLENQIDQLTGQVQKMRKLYKRLKEEGYV